MTLETRTSLPDRIAAVDDWHRTSGRCENCSRAAVSARVMIVGTGLGSLVLAPGLTRFGFDIAVYERDSHSGTCPQASTSS